MAAISFAPDSKGPKNDARGLVLSTDRIEIGPVIQYPESIHSPRHRRLSQLASESTNSPRRPSLSPPAPEYIYRPRQLSLTQQEYDFDLSYADPIVPLREIDAAVVQALEQIEQIKEAVEISTEELETLRGLLANGIRKCERLVAREAQSQSDGDIEQYDGALTSSDTLTGKSNS